MKKQATVCGAGGFVGGYLVKRLLDSGYDVVAISSSPTKNWNQLDPRAENVVGDLMCPINCNTIIGGSSLVFNLAAKVGGINFIQGPSKSSCLEGAMINLNLLRACEKSSAFETYFFASSACVYGDHPEPCNEAETVNPSLGYGEEKFFSERACAEFAMERRMDIRIARYFTLYGYGDHKPGKDHVPTALAKKWAKAKHLTWTTGAQHPVDIWGNGMQVRSFLHVEDAVEGTMRMVQRPRPKGLFPMLLNLSDPTAYTIDAFGDVLDDISGFRPVRAYDPSAPVGCQTRRSDNTFCKATLGWEPQVPLIDGMRMVFHDCWERELGMKK